MLILRLWKQQPGKYFCISSKSAAGTWRDEFFTKSEFKLIPQYIKDNEDKDLYWCPHGFSRAVRKKPFAVIPNLLWSDMDEADPRKTKLKPTVAIESSPNRYVGIWVLDEPMNEMLNRRLAYGLGGDVSGWDLTQVLRIPNTINYKYSSQPKTKVLWSDGPDWSIRELDKALPSDKKMTPMEASDASTIYKKWKDKLPGWARRELMAQKTPPPGKRSEMLWKLGNTLIEAGVDEEDALCLLKASVWNKFAGRRNEDEQLRREWDKGVNKHLNARRPVAGEYKDDYEFLSRPISEVEEEDIDWIWYPFIARKMVTILEGDPEAGKSFISQYLSAHVCLGLKMPSDRKDIDPTQGPVAYFDVENDINAVTKKRLRWFGGYHTLPNFYQEEKTFSIDDPDAMEKVFEALERVRPALIVFDTLNTYIGAANTNQGAQSQQSFVRFLEMAKRFNCGCLVLRHLTKGGRDKAMYRGQGNIAFTGVARVQMLAGKHPTDPDMRVLARSKGNLTKKPRALLYEVSDGSTKEEADRAAFKWHGFSDIDAEEIVAAEAGDDKDAKKERHEARDFLLDTLKDGEIELPRLMKMAEARSISERTLQRAAKELRVHRVSGGRGANKVTLWSLPDT